jgi:hypothetical protein
MHIDIYYCNIYQNGLPVQNTIVSRKIYLIKSLLQFLCSLAKIPFIDSIKMTLLQNAVHSTPKLCQQLINTILAVSQRTRASSYNQCTTSRSLPRLYAPKIVQTKHPEQSHDLCFSNIPLLLLIFTH